MRRIPYLAEQRNLALKTLLSLNDQFRRRAELTYDRIIFLNDVLFQTSDMLTLLATHDGDYAAACALDFQDDPVYHDTFTVRDSMGDPMVSTVFPYLRSAESRQGMLRGQATKVRSCWNGMIAMDAGGFMASSGPLPALSFREKHDRLAEDHVEGSDCCLIHADMALLGIGDAGVWVDPGVRVGYNEDAYSAVQPEGPAEFITTREYILGVWVNRLKSWLTTEWFKKRTIAERIQHWRRKTPKAGPERSELGQMCLVDEMQVLVDNGYVSGAVAQSRPQS